MTLRNTTSDAPQSDIPKAPRVESPSVIEQITKGEMHRGPLVLGCVLATVAVFFSSVHLHFAYFGQPESFTFKSLHVSLALIICFLARPLGRTSWSDSINGYLIVDLVLIAAAIGVQSYILYDYFGFVMRRGTYNFADMVVGIIAILIVLEATRRVVGWVMIALVVFFIVQAIHGSWFPGIFEGPDIRWQVIITGLFMEEHGLYSTPIAVSASFVVLFIVFGAFVLRVGLGELFIDLAFALTGRQAGAPAKAAVLSSAAMASISGSAVSNVATTGVMTIPLMRKVGLPRISAAAVEACASTGGVFTPPIMGAVAFILAEFMQIPYWDVVKAAAIPAALYFISLVAVVHFRCARMGVQPDPHAVAISALGALRKRGHLLLPILVLVGTLVVGYSVAFSAIAGIVSIFAVSWLRADTRLTPIGFLSALEDAGRMMVTVAVPSAAAGLVIGSVFYSGLAVRFSTSIIELASGNQFLALVLAMIICIVLGMGITVTALYILVAALVVPGLTELGVEPLAAHFFAFHFGVHSYITPPVAFAAFAAATIAGTKPMRTAVESARFGFAAYLIPFMFVYNIELLGLGSWPMVLLETTVAVTALVAIAAAAEGWFMGRLSAIQRAVVGGVAAVTIVSEGVFEIGALAVLAGLGLMRLLIARSTAVNDGTTP